MAPGNAEPVPSGSAATPASPDPAAPNPAPTPAPPRAPVTGRAAVPMRPSPGPAQPPAPPAAPPSPPAATPPQPAAPGAAPTTPAPAGSPSLAEYPGSGAQTPQAHAAEARRGTPVLAVHTGAGKGKTTAAFGMALRAWSVGWPVAVYQFVKSPAWRIGEETALRLLGESAKGGPVTWHKMGEGWSWRPRPGDERNHAAEAAEGWAQVKRDLAAEAYGLYVLDEFTYPLQWGWIDVADVVRTLLGRPGVQHVVITGRYAPPALVEVADLVTDMTKIKHPGDAGRKGQQGIDW
jgi:cob(I)alamin adenosyltransferase